jgi:hypothetical protein
LGINIIKFVFWQSNATFVQVLGIMRSPAISPDGSHALNKFRNDLV